jgi:DNA-binding NarL/FixJ family response regulator
MLRESVALVRSGESLVDTRLLAQMLHEMPQDPAGQPPAAEPADTAALGPHNLSALERQVLRGMVNGLTNGEIALQLHYSHGTVKNAVQRINEKLGVSDRTQAAVRAVRESLVAD